MNLYGSWYVIPVKVVGPVTKRLYAGSGMREFSRPIFMTALRHIMTNICKFLVDESDFIVLPLINIETNFGKETCDLIAVCRLFLMQWMEQLIHKEK